MRLRHARKRPTRNCMHCSPNKGTRAAKIPGLKLFPGTGIPGNSGKNSQEFPGMPKLLQKCTKNWYFQVKLQIFNELSSFWASGRTYLSIEVHLKEKKNFKNFQIFGKFWWNLRFITMKNSRKFPGTEKNSRELPGTEFYGNSREFPPGNSRERSPNVGQFVQS